MDTKSASTTGNINSTPKRMKFRPSGTTQEQHKRPIYCVSWSTDVFVEEKEEAEAEAEAKATGRNETNFVAEHASGDNVGSEVGSPALRYFRCLATCSGCYVTIYEIEVPDPYSQSPSSSIGDSILKQAYVDSTAGSKNDREDFFACAFGGRASPLEHEDEGGGVVNMATGTKRKFEHRESTTETKEKLDKDSFVRRYTLSINTEDARNWSQLICAAGSGRAIKVINPVTRKLQMNLQGHGDDINDLQFSPADEWLLLSASKDTSCRLWNLRNGTSIAIFSGHRGHRDMVISASWHCSGGKFVSGSYDTTVKIWNIENGQDGKMIKDATNNSNRVKLKVNERNILEPISYFKPVQCQFPIFSTNKVHINCVDCVSFLGDIVLSKSIDSIVMWELDDQGSEENPQRIPNGVKVLRTFHIKKSEIWFSRFGIDQSGEFLTVGNTDGDVLVWNVEQRKEKEHTLLRASIKRTTAVRKTSFSPDNKILVCCCDDGRLCKWDIS